MDSLSGVYNGLERSPISFVAQFGYSVGHILNDLCASCWFSYLIIYLTDVQQQSKDFAGLLMLVGQIGDGLSTTLVGVAIDKVNNRYGKRKTWHIIGTICVAVSFAFIFNKCIGCEDKSVLVQQTYYGLFILMFQFGWASTQISHLSLIPVLTVCRKKIVFLNSVRSGLTFFCGIFIYLLMWILLHVFGSGMEPLGPGDAKAFSYLAFIVIGVGTTFSIIFHLMVREPSDDELRAQIEEQATLLEPERSQRSIKDWLKLKKFYLVGAMYMFTRMAVNIPQVYLPLYLTQSIYLKKESIAYYPLMMLICSVIGSFVSRPLVKFLGKRITYMCGALLVVGSSFWFQYQSTVHFCTTYGATALVGAGGSIMLIMSLSMTADLIGINTETGSFVYGSMSLLDKASNGIAIALIQHFIPDCHSGVNCPTADYFRYIMSIMPGVAATLGALVTVILSVLSYLSTRNVQPLVIQNSGSNERLIEAEEVSAALQDPGALEKVRERSAIPT